MARFLSDEWIAAFNAAIEGDRIGEDATSVSVRAESNTFSVEERVSGVPGRAEEAGPLRVVLRVADGLLTLGAASEDPPRPDVVVSLSYEDAAALSRGELDPGEALGSGRVHVRGDLAVLVAGQGILAWAATRMGEVQSLTTY